MYTVRRLAGIAAAWAVVLGVGVIATGCGSSSSNPAPLPQSPVTSAAPTATPKTKGLAEGGDKTARDRRNDRLKANKAGK